MKKVLLLSLLIPFFCCPTGAQVVETLISHPKIADGLYVDEYGDVYTTSGGLTGGYEIGKYDVSEATYDPNFANGFSGPINIARYRDSLFIVSNYDNSTVYSYNLNSGQIISIAAGLDGPAGVVIDDNDNIYVSNWGQGPAWAGHQIHKISSDGAVGVYVDSPILYRPQAIAINHENEIIVHSQKKLYKINEADSSLSLWVNMGHYLGNMVFREKDSCIYGASNLGHKIIKINEDGEVSVFSGSTQGSQDGEINSALFNTPLGIAFSSNEDTLYVCEGGSVNRLRRILMDSMISIVSDLEQDRVNVSPNPSTGLFKIEFKNENLVTAEIFDVNGALVISNIEYGEELIVDLSSYSSGVYFVKLSDMHGNVLTRKIVKE